jgi:5-methylcytosine-specific restriction endonuclease McrA
VKSGYTKSCGCFIARGIEHYNYNPNLTELERKIKRSISGMSKWKLQVKERDEYRCVVCSSTTELVVHHIYNYADNQLLRTDVTNGATLCLQCHKEFHKQYGTRNTKQLQFDEFKKEKQWTNLMHCSPNS